MNVCGGCACDYMGLILAFIVRPGLIFLIRPSPVSVSSTPNQVIYTDSIHKSDLKKTTNLSQLSKALGNGVSEVLEFVGIRLTQIR